MNRQIYQCKLEKDTLEDEMKVLRKKNSDLVKKCSELEYLLECQEKYLEDHKRKEVRHRREL